MAAGRIDQMTEAQRICLRLVLSHHNSKEIAAIVGVSPSAIDKRIERAVHLLGAGSRFEAARRLQDNEREPRDLIVTQDDAVVTPPPFALGGSRPAEVAPAETAVKAEIPAPSDRRDALVTTCERLPSDPIDIPNFPSTHQAVSTTGPWGLVRRFLGLTQRTGSTGVARNRLSVGDRVMRLIGLMGMIAVTSMALVNMAMTLTTLLRSSRGIVAPIHGAVTTVPSGGFSMLKQRRDAADAVTSIFLAAEAAVDHAAMLAASCVSTLLQQRVAANLPVATGTAALQLVSQASFDMISARQRFVDAHRALIDVRHEIGLGQFYGYGDTAECPPNEGALRGPSMPGADTRLTIVA